MIETLIIVAIICADLILFSLAIFTIVRVIECLIDIGLFETLHKLICIHKFQFVKYTYEYEAIPQEGYKMQIKYMILQCNKCKSTKKVKISENKLKID